MKASLGNMFRRGHRAIAYGKTGYSEMDYILGHDNNRMNDYYRTMGALEARAVTESGLTAAQFIQNSRVRIDFNNNLSLFIANKLEIINGDYTSQQKAMAIK